MSEQKELSIIIACHSCTPFFRETLDSIIDWRGIFGDAELIICDDNSPAGGDGDTAREYAGKYPDFIRCIRNSTSSGAAVSYQRLVSEAGGRYIMPFDSDDIFVPFDVQDSIKELDEHPEWCANYGKKMLFSGKDGFLGQSNGGDYSTFALLLDPRMTHIGMIIRASELSGKRGYLRADSSSGQVACDVCMWSCLCATKEMHFRNEIRGFYRIHPGQETKERQNLFAGEYERLRDNFLLEHRSVAEKITAGKGFSISADEKFIASAICGIKFIRATSFADRFFYVDAATQILPDDYGANEYKIKLLLGSGKRDEALKQLILMLAGHSGKLYVKSVILRELCEFFREDQRTAAQLAGIYNSTTQDFFFMTESQKQLLQKTIDKAKSYL